MHVLLQLSALHIKHVDQHLHIAEDVVSLTREVVLHERVLSVRYTFKDEKVLPKAAYQNRSQRRHLPTAVPQVQHQITQKPHVRVLHVN